MHTHQELVRGDLQRIIGWIETTKEKRESIDTLDEANVDQHSRLSLSPLQLASLGPTPFSEAIELLAKTCKDVNQVIGASKWVCSYNNSKSKQSYSYSMPNKSVIVM